MLKKLIFIVLLLLIVTVVATMSLVTGSNDDIKVSRIVTISSHSFDNGAEKQLATKVYVENIAVDTDYDDVRVTIVIPELGIRKQVGPFDLDADSNEVRTVIIDAIDEAGKIQPGEYVARITVTANDNEIRRVRHAVAIVE